MKAVIFDMDGVISDTNFLQSKIEEEILKKSVRSILAYTENFKL